MKKLTIIIFSLIISLFLSAQNDADFSRKEKVLVETGYNAVIGFQGGTGSLILFGDGSTITTFGFNGGYFLSDDFAIKFGLGIFSSGGTLTNLSLGGKYYIVGKAPIEAGVGLISIENERLFFGNASIGYGIRLANNINLEPSIGLLFGDNGTIGKFGVNFAMFL